MAAGRQLERVRGLPHDHRRPRVVLKHRGDGDVVTPARVHDEVGERANRTAVIVVGQRPTRSQARAEEVWEADGTDGVLQHIVVAQQHRCAPARAAAG